VKVTIYTDGGADPNPGIGGWAALLRFGQREKVLTGNEPHTTNNRMELTAAVKALEVLNRPCEIEFHTDSEYLRRGITKWIDNWRKKGWRTASGKPVSNADLWQKLDPLTKEHQIEWHWVRGHSGDPLNERVDDLAREARLEITPDLTVSPDAPRIYLRASCKGNPGPGGWGVVLESKEGTTQASGSEPETTNNRMEVRAAIEGLKLLPPGSEAQLLTTSDYLYQGATNWIRGWRQRNWQKRGGKPVANADLWQELDQMLKRYRVQWKNVKGTRGEELQGLDEAARLAADAVDFV
jgi:ribonuclease HI